MHTVPLFVHTQMRSIDGHVGRMFHSPGGSLAYNEFTPSATSDGIHVLYNNQKIKVYSSYSEWTLF